MSETPSLLRTLSNIDCPHCDPRYQITQARLIDPISQSIAELERRSGGLTHHRDSFMSHSTYDINIWQESARLAQTGLSGSDETAISPQLSHSHARSGDSNDSTSGSTSATGSDQNPRNPGGRFRTWLPKRRSLKAEPSGHHRKTSSTSETAGSKKSTVSKKLPALPPSLRYTFTATGSDLLIWTGNSLVRFTIPSLEAVVYEEARNISFVAGGDQILAVVTTGEAVGICEAHSYDTAN